jgi:hypothetical protein
MHSRGVKPAKKKKWQQKQFSVSQPSLIAHSSPRAIHIPPLIKTVTHLIFSQVTTYHDLIKKQKQKIPAKNSQKPAIKKENKTKNINQTDMQCSSCTPKTP